MTVRRGLACKPRCGGSLPEAFYRCPSAVRGARLSARLSTLVLLAALLLAAASTCTGIVLPPGYACNCIRKPAKDCLCPSLSAPGGLPPARTPQFVLFTHDDAIKQTTHDAMLSVTAGRQTPNGCPVTATMFTTHTNTNCSLLVDLYNRGYEIAEHTATHISMLNLTQAQLIEQIVDSRADNAACGVPKDAIVGFRAPFLETDRNVRQTLFKDGFLYESTVIELGGVENIPYSLSMGMGKRLWPYTMDFGLPQNCKGFAPYQFCDINETYPGMWQIPLWDLTAKGGPFTMDYGDTNHSTFEVLKANFDATYNGNRAPMPLYIHTPWLVAGKNLTQTQQFVDYALGKPDVYFVTMRQLIAWMNNPIPADQLTPELLGCGNVGGAGPKKVVGPNSLSPEPAPGPGTGPAPSPAVGPATPEPAPRTAGAVEMPASGVKITMVLEGVDGESFQQSVQAPLVDAVSSLLAVVDPAAIFVEITQPQAAGAVKESSNMHWGAMDSGVRRFLRQQPAEASAPSLPQLEVVVVVGGEDPEQMAAAVREALSDGLLDTVLTNAGAKLLAAPEVVAFKDGVEVMEPAEGAADAQSAQGGAEQAAPAAI